MTMIPHPAQPGTEMPDAGGVHLDELSDAVMFDVLLASQAKAVEAVRGAADALQAAIGRAIERLRHPGARLIYCGAGTSGRLALLDAVELDPTFGWPHDRIEVLLAGGRDSFFEAQEGVEDDRDAAMAGIDAIAPSAEDVVIGLAASGTTPFVLAAIEAARAAGALTIGLANNPGAPLLAQVDCPILLATGSEALAGSTRLAAGTSQKIALNIVSTAIMTRLGRVYRGRMVDMRVTNAKLSRRAVRIVQDIVGCDEPQARAALERTGDAIKPAILVALGVEPATATAALMAHDANLAAARRRLGV